MNMYLQSMITHKQLSITKLMKLEMQIETSLYLQGKIVPSSFSVTYFDGSTTVTANPVASVSYYQYEDKLNETKSKIQIIRPKFIEDFVRIYYSRLVQGGNLSVARGLSDITTEK